MLGKRMKVSIVIPCYNEKGTLTSMQSPTQGLTAGGTPAVIRVYDDAGNVIETHEHRARQ
jgi:hypothetical protein